MRIENFSEVLIFKNVARCLDMRIEGVLVTARAAVATKAQARALEIKPGGAMLTTEMVYLTDRQRTIEVTITTTPSEHFVLSYDIALDVGQARPALARQGSSFPIVRIGQADQET